MDPDVGADWIGHSHCEPAAADHSKMSSRESGYHGKPCATSRRTHKSKKHGSHLCNPVNGTHGDLGEGRAEVGSGSSKTSGLLLVVKHPLRHTLSGLPNANAKSQPFSYAISQIAPLPGPPVVALTQMLLLKPLFHFTIEKRDNTRGI